MRSISRSSPLGLSTNHPQPNVTSLTGSKGPGGLSATNRSAVHRQWNTRKDNIQYEELLNIRRKERVENIDRYVPPPGNPHPSRRPPLPAGQAQARPQTQISRAPSKWWYFPFTKLPDQVRARVLTLLLVKQDGPIKIDFTWLRSFIAGHARLPSATQIVRHEGAEYTLSLPFDRIVQDVMQMQEDLKPFAFALEVRATKTKKTRAPCKGLTTALLRVSWQLHKEGARVFYAENEFCFPCATSGWMQLESFLITIGRLNVSSLQSIRIHVPLWHRGVQEDFVEGAVLDLTSPASKLGIVKPSAADRLLSAIRHSVPVLAAAPTFKTLTLDLEHGQEMHTWTGRFLSSHALIALPDAEEHVTRRAQGSDLLKQLSATLSIKPTLRVSIRGSSISRQLKKAFAEQLTRVKAEASKYGWDVDDQLRLLR